MGAVYAPSSNNPPHADAGGCSAPGGTVRVEFGDLGVGVVTVDGDRVTVDHRCSYFSAAYLLAGVVPQSALDAAFLPPLVTVEREPEPGPLDQVG